MFRLRVVLAGLVLLAIAAGAWEWVSVGIVLEVTELPPEQPDSGVVSEQVDSTSGLAARLMLDEGQDCSRLWVQLQVSDDSDTIIDQRFLGADRSGHLCIGNISPGTASLEIGTLFDPLPTVRVADVELKPGEISLEKRLNPLDLRGVFAQVEISVIRVDGGPVEDVWYVASPSARTRPEHIVAGWPPCSTFSLLTSKLPLDIVAGARNARAQCAIKVLRRHDFRLGSGIPVAVRLDGDWRVPAPLALEVQMIPVHLDPIEGTPDFVPGMPIHGIMVGENGEARVQLAAPGIWRIGLRMKNPNNGAHWNVAHHTDVDVMDLEEIQVFHLKPDKKAFEEAKKRRL